MPSRKIIPYGKGLVLKRADIARKLPKISSLEELQEKKNLFSKKEFLALAQTFVEMEIWNSCNWAEKEVLAPILGVKYNNSNVPMLIQPFFHPVFSEEETYRFEEDESLIEIGNRLLEKGCSEHQIEQFFTNLVEFCDTYDMCEEDILCNGSNLGYHPQLGPRIIDYGLTNDLLKEYYEIRE